MGKHFFASASALCSIAFLLIAPAVSAQTTNWIDATGDWFNAANWDSGVPNAATNAFINNGGTAQITGAGALALNAGIGSSGGGVGTVSVSGPGATWTMSGSLDVGLDGTGTVNISSSGAVAVNGAFARLGGHAGGVGTVTITGTNSRLTLAHELDVGREGTGTLTIQSGGVLNMTGTNRADIGAQPGGTGTATVSGTGSMWTMSGPLRVGNGGTGTLTIESGGVVSNTNGDIGIAAGAVGTVNVIGSGSMWTINGFSDVGVDGTGTLNISSGGVVSGTLEMAIAEFDGTGTVNVDGSGSKLMLANRLTVSESGNAILNITSGGSVSNTIGTIGEFGTGVVNVTGSGSTWTNSSNLVIGEFGSGTLHIMSGGKVSNTFAEIGDQTGSTGTVTVDGMGSTWTNSADLEVGAHGGNGSLAITNGGKVSNTDAEVGHDAGSTGMVTVDGAGSLWTNSLDLNVGYNGTGTLFITNGGGVSSAGGFIGTFAGSNGRVILDSGLDPMDPSSGWGSSSNIYVGGNASGDGGTGLLSIMNESFVTAPNVFVLSPGRLDGKGFIFGSVNNSGLVAPGNDVGTLVIQHNYIQNPSGTLQIEIGGLNAGVNSDLLAVGPVGGNATLDGTLQLIRVNNFLPVPGQRVNIITDTASHSGTFSDVDLVNWGLIQPVPMYNEPNDIYVVFQLSNTFASQALTPNQEAVARNLDNAANDPAAAALIGFIGSEPLGNLPHEYDLIAPEELAAIYEVGFAQAVVQADNLQRRMDDIRAGSTGYCPPSVEISASMSKDGKDAGISDKNAAPAPAVVPTSEKSWGTFVTGSGNFVNVGNDDFNAHGYDIATGNFTLGGDYRFGEHFAVGIDGGYSASTADLVDDGRIEVDGGKIGVYGTFFGNGLFGSKFYVDAAVSGGWNSYDTKRTGLQDLPVRGDTNGCELNSFIAYGAEWTFGCLNLGTWSSLQYTNVSIDSFTEEGSLAPLHIQDQDEDSVRGTTGVRAAYDIRSGRAIIRPEVRAAYFHEYNNRSYPIDASLASGAGDVFRVRGPEIGRSGALVGAGVSVQWSRCCSTYIYYDGVLGRENYDNNAVSGGLRVSF